MSPTATWGRFATFPATFPASSAHGVSSGATGNDAVHFIDLFNWLIGASPLEVYAIRRDHFGRGLGRSRPHSSDVSGGVVGKIEAGYVQPGRWVDNIVPDALSTKEMQVCGAEGAIEIDYQAERLTWHKVRHEQRRMAYGGRPSRTPKRP